MRTTHLPSCFGIPRPSCAPWLFIDALSHLFLHSRHTSFPLPSASSICLFHRRQRTSNVASSLSLHLPLPSASSTDIKEVPTSLHHCRFIAVASSMSLLHCHNVTTSGRYLGATWHQKHHIIFLVRNTKYEPNRGMQKVEQILTWEGSLPFL